MAITAIDLKPKVGSELKLDVASLLSGEHAKEIRDIWSRRGVLVLRDVHFTPDQQRTFARSLGDVRQVNANLPLEGKDGLEMVHINTKKNPEAAQYGFGSMFWHIDNGYDEYPPFGSILTPQVLSLTGGETEFANTYAAYEDLPEAEKRFLDTVQVVHTMQAALYATKPDCSPEEFAKWCVHPPSTQPLVWRHKSGRKSLLLTGTASHVVGMTAPESQELLRWLMTHATQDCYVYRHHWRMGDVVMWDNTGTMHRVRPFDIESGRKLHRFTLNGEEPVRGVEAALTS